MRRLVNTHALDEARTVMAFDGRSFLAQLVGYSFAALAMCLVASCAPEATQTPQPQAAPELDETDEAQPLGDIEPASVLRRANSAEPRSLDPHYAEGTWENNIIGDMFVGLMTEGADGERIYGAAASYEASDDGLTYRFQLREDMTWSDEAPVTAGDFAYAFRRLLDPANAAPYASVVFAIENAREVNAGRAPLDALGVTAIEDHVLEFQLESPTPYFLDLLTHITTYPLPAHVMASASEDWLSPESIVVNGPYKLAEWSPGEYVRLAKNESFYDAEAVSIDEVVYYPFVDPAAVLDLFLAGEIDVSHGRNGYPFSAIDQIDAAAPGARRDEVLLSLEYIVANTLRSPFDDPRVRQALSLAIDRQELSVRFPGLAPAWSIVPPHVANYVDTPPLAAFVEQPYSQRLEEAARLLESAGFSQATPLRFTYFYRSGGVEQDALAQAVVDMWSTAGVVVRAEGRPAGEAYDLLDAGEFEVGNAGWRADYNDPKTFLYLASEPAGRMNYARYANPEADALLEEAAQTLDLSARAQLLARVEALLLADQAILPLFHATNRNLVAVNVQGWAENPIGVHRTRFLSISE